MTHFPRLMISAAHKSSGKTVISTGLAAAFRDAGHDIGTFKKGPDYIDPMWLSAASGAPCYNLDFNAMQRGEIKPFFQSRAQSGVGGLSLVEANKGLFDGVHADGGDSNAALAKLLCLPVVLVIDTGGVTRGIAPLLLGYCGFDEHVNIAGVILNKVAGSRHERKLRESVEGYTDLPVLGAVARQPGLEIGERHLGLTTPDECDGQSALITGFADAVRAGVDLDALIRVATSAPDMPRATVPPTRGNAGQGLRIGVARDTAFGFYYPDDLEALQAQGAELVFIDMIHDSHLPDIDGLFIGGGFPEMRMQALSANIPLRAQLKTALDNGLPTYAECGGLMYLCRSLNFNEQTLPMVGAINGDAVMHTRPQGRGYVAFEDTDSHPWGAAGQRQTAHEFHYASIDNLALDTKFARTMIRGAGISGQDDAVVIHNIVAGFCHLRNTGPSPWVPRFLKFVSLASKTKRNPATMGGVSEVP